MSPHLALHLLGHPKIELDHAPIVVDRRKTLALLTYLSMNQGTHSRDYISALFWPEYDQAKAFTNLRHTLWETQQIIGEGWVVADHETLGLIANTDHLTERVVWLDIAHFESLITESRKQNDISLRISLLTDSVKMYRNHFLTGFSLKDAPTFNEWVFAESENLRRQLASALTTLSDDYCSSGQAETAIPHAQRLITLDPLNEASHRQLMQIYIHAGQHNAALKQYQTCEKILRKELGVDPQPETRALYKQIRKGEFKAIQPPPQKEMGGQQHNLPFQLSTFIGREKEQSEIANLISGHRLVTLVGTGGIGKTRLSLKVGEQLVGEYGNGAWFVELASLSDPTRVPYAVARLFNLTEESEEPLTDKIIRVLQPKTVLLILDNCEHMLDACAQLSDSLLKNCPNLKILATSREPLGITGEAQYHVPPLGLPDVQQVLAKLLEYESVQLFEQRARLVQEDFSLTMGNASSIAQICRRLDGIPLAIELAAAHVNMLSLEQIAMRLDEKLTLLTKGNRTTLPRHQTIRASIDWSWNLLSKAEQTLLQRLSVFMGGWGLAGAEAVNDNIPQTFDLLHNLVEKSLVLFERKDERYFMLETVREYALERLREAGEEETTRDKHLGFYMEMAEQAEPKLLGREQGVWMKKLGDEQENIVAAHHWCDNSPPRTERGFRLLGGTRYYWIYAGLASVGFKMYREALNRNKTAESTLAVGLTHDGAAIFAMHMSSPLIMEHVEKSIPIFRAHQDHVRLAMALTRKAWGVMLLGNEDEAIRAYQEAIGIGRQLMDKRPVSAALNNLAGLYCMREEFDKAGPCFEEALAIDREREDSTGIILGLVNISRNTLEQDKQLVGVRSKLAEAAKIAMEAHLREYFQFIIETSSLVRFSLGDHLQGARLFCAALAELKIKGNQLDPTDVKHFEHWTARIRETVGETAFAEALEAGGRLSYEEAMAETRKWLDESD